MRTLKRFLISHPFPDELEGNQKVLLPSEETHHLKHVLRMKPGEECLISDGKGHEFLSRVLSFLKDGRSELLLLKPSCQTKQSRVKLSVAQALMQHGKMDGIAEKAAELGLFSLIPIISERTVVRPKEDQARKIRARWDKIARQTVKQSRAPAAPQMEQPLAFEQLWSGSFSFDRTFLLHPDPKARSLKALDFKDLERAGKILLVIGPEGGFSPAEVEKARQAGAEIIQMGFSILKTDTAFVVAAGFFQIMLGES